MRKRAIPKTNASANIVMIKFSFFLSSMAMLEKIQMWLRTARLKTAHQFANPALAASSEHFQNVLCVDA
jgi:hypothetical protein